MKNIELFRDPEIEFCFRKGSYREICARTVDSPHWKLQREPAVIGALCFLGRMEDAAYWVSRLQCTSHEDIGFRAISGFFLSIGYVRLSDYARAREWISTLFKMRHQLRSRWNRFFMLQALAFYLHFSGKYARSQRMSFLAKIRARDGDFTYGSVLALDLFAHSALKLGRIGEGCVALTRARELASTAGLTSHSSAIRVALLIAKAQNGLNPDKIVMELREACVSTEIEDNYSQAALLLELGNQLCLRARLEEASSTLGQASNAVHRYGHRRFGALLNLRYAQLLSLRGEAEQALNLVATCRDQIDAEVDQELRQKIVMFESAIPNGFSFPMGKLSPEDALGSLIEKARSRRASPAEILSHGYLSLLCLLRKEVQPGQLAIEVDLVPGSLTLFGPWGVRHVASFKSQQLRALLAALAQGCSSKESLVQRVWGYRYHAHRHDPLLYTSIALLRGKLGSGYPWIELSSAGYRISPRVRVFGIGTREPSGKRAQPERSTQEIFNYTDINYRQSRILAYLKANSCVDLKTARTLLDASAITLSRDLSALAEKGHVARLGKGRATKYILRDAGF